MRYLLSVFIVAVTLLAPGATMRGAAQEPGDDVNRDRANAAATATEILRLAGERKFNTMYDYMHPDAMAVVPRAAAVGTFTDVYTEAQAGQAQITGVEMVPWTWGVTGTEYPYAARISFVQPFVDENNQQTWLEDDMYLVESGGEWRWFFGSNAETVQQAIETYGQRSQPVTEGDLIQNVVDDLDAFYADVLSYTPTPYHSPGVVLVAPNDRVSTPADRPRPGSTRSIARLTRRSTSRKPSCWRSARPMTSFPPSSSPMSGRTTSRIPSVWSGLDRGTGRIAGRRSTPSSWS